MRHYALYACTWIVIKKWHIEDTWDALTCACVSKSAKMGMVSINCILKSTHGRSSFFPWAGGGDEESWASANRDWTTAHGERGEKSALEWIFVNYPPFLGERRQSVRHHRVQRVLAGISPIQFKELTILLLYEGLDHTYIWWVDCCTFNSILFDIRWSANSEQAQWV